MELSREALLDHESMGRRRAERVQNSEVPCVRYLDRSDREDVRLHQPRCHNASAYSLRGYVDNTLSSRCYAITMILRVRRNFFEITTFPNTRDITWTCLMRDPGEGGLDRVIVGERSNFKKFPTHTQDHGDA